MLASIKKNQFWQQIVRYLSTMVIDNHRKNMYGENNIFFNKNEQYVVIHSSIASEESSRSAHDLDLLLPFEEDCLE